MNWLLSFKQLYTINLSLLIQSLSIFTLFIIIFLFLIRRLLLFGLEPHIFGDLAEWLQK